MNTNQNLTAGTKILITDQMGTRLETIKRVVKVYENDTYRYAGDTNPYPSGSMVVQFAGHYRTVLRPGTWVRA